MKRRTKKDDNNQHDDVIFWLNAPLGREKKEEDGERERETFHGRYSDNINSNVIVE